MVERSGSGWEVFGFVAANDPISFGDRFHLPRHPHYCPDLSTRGGCHCTCLADPSGDHQITNFHDCLPYLFEHVVFLSKSAQG